MDITSSRRLRFGLFEVDPRSGELRKDGSKIKLQEKPFQLLLLLIERSPDLVTRDELREALWPADTFVDFDHSVGTAVAKLRSALGDSAKAPRYVETVASRGYRFIAPVTPVSYDSPQADAAVNATSPLLDVSVVPTSTVVDHDIVSPSNVRPSMATVPPRGARHRVTLASALAAVIVAVLAFDIGGARTRLHGDAPLSVHSLAVLPLQNLSKDPSEEYFVDGMTEQLITTLAQLRGLRVISRTSAMQYKATSKRVPVIARELNADAVLEGSIVRSGDRVRITAQLIDARTDQHLWAKSYDRDFGDVIAVQNEIAAAIASEVRLQLTPEERTQLSGGRVGSLAAQEAYLRGRFHLNNGDEGEVRKSVDYFNQAIAADATDPRSYVGLAQAYIALTDFWDSPTETMPRARAAADTAVRLDDTLADGHASLGAVRFLYDWDWRGAEAEFRRALTLNDASADAHVWYGVFLSQMGRFNEAIAQMSQAESLDPLAVPVRINAGWVYYLARRNDEAVAEWKKALDIDPHLGVAHTSIWLAYARKGGAAHADAPVPADPNDSSPLNLATLAGIYAMAGDRPRAKQVLGRIEDLASHRYVCAYEVATAHAVLNNREQAIEWLRRGLKAHSICMPDLKVDPRFDSLRSDPRFVALLRDVGFTDR